MNRWIVADRSRRACFLMYHSIAESGPEFLSLPPELFERQLALLRRNGYKAGRISDLRALASGARLDAPRIFLTFDDGFADNYHEARPLLAEYGFTSLTFILPPLVDTGAPLLWPGVEDMVAEFPQTMRSMDWAMVDEMAGDGHEFGSHTLAHPRLDLLEGDELRQQLLDSRHRVQERLGSCDTIAYPFGDWSPAVLSAARDCGYDFAFIVSPMSIRGATPLAIPRLPVDYRDDERRLGAKLSLAARYVYFSPLLPAARRALGKVKAVVGR